MAELFLQELEPAFISRPTTDRVGYDLLVGFTNERGGINTFAVEVKGTEQPPSGPFSLTRTIFERFAHSNIPGLLLVADVKHNQLYYAWLNASSRMSGTANVSIPLMMLDEESTGELTAQLRAVDGVPAAG
jgi:hypothetical protein